MVCILMTAGLFLILGFAVGTFGALVGIGGGLILIPVFLLVLEYPAQQAIGTSLFIVFLNAISGTYAYLKQKKVFFHAAIRFGIATIPGAFLGSYIAQYFTGKSFSLTFGIFLICMAALMYFKSGKKMQTQDFNPKTFQYNTTFGVICSIGVGFLSSILGVGGGIIHVPMMISVLGFPAHVATATSTCILGISSLVGVISHFLLGHVLWLPGLCIGVGAIFGAQAGAKIASKIKPRMIVTILSIVVLGMGIKFITSSIG